MLAPVHCPWPSRSLAFVIVAASVGCQDDTTPSCDDPDLTSTTESICPGQTEAHEVFNAFWSALDQHYAVFDIRLPDEDWRELGERACPDVDAAPAGDALFDVLMQLGRTLDDGHVQLEAAELDRDEDAWVSVYPHEDQVERLEGIVEDGYLDGPLRYAADDEIAWGTMGRVGYLSITSMDGLSQSEEESDDIAAVATALRSAMDRLRPMEAIVVDVRANGGGWDTVSLEIATWFAGPRVLAWSEQRRAGPDHAALVDTEEVFVPAARPEAFGGPVVVLTSGGTFSAAETFVLAMRQRDPITLVGEPTSGHFSDLLTTCLPNGWTLSQSGERYRAADGMIYEGRGVPPDLEVGLDPEALAQGRDVMLEAALMELGQ